MKCVYRCAATFTRGQRSAAEHYSTVNLCCSSYTPNQPDIQFLWIYYSTEKHFPRAQSNTLNFHVLGHVLNSLRSKYWPVLLTEVWRNKHQRAVRGALNDNAFVCLVLHAHSVRLPKAGVRIYQLINSFPDTCMMAAGIARSVQWPGCCLDDRGIEVWFPTDERRSSLLQNKPDEFWGPPSLIYNGHRGRKTNHSHSSNAEVKKESNCTPTSPYAFMACTR